MRPSPSRVVSAMTCCQHMLF